MAWTDLGAVDANGCYRGSFVEYAGGLAWLNALGRVYTCTTGGASVTRIDNFTYTVLLPQLVNFKNELYVSLHDSATGDIIVTKYSGAGTVWSEVLKVSGVAVARTGLSVTDDFIIAIISGDLGADTWDVRKSLDGSTWGAVSKPSGDTWDNTGGAGLSDWDGNAYVFLYNDTDGDQYLGHLALADSTLSISPNLTDLDLNEEIQIGVQGNAAAATYYNLMSSPYTIYRSVDFGATRTACGAHYLPEIYSVGGVDFRVETDPNPPSDLKIYTYAYGGSLSSWSELETVPADIPAATNLGGVAKVGSDLYIFARTHIYKSTTFSGWPLTPQPASDKHQMLQSVSTPFNGGDYFWTTWLNDNVMQLHKRSLTSGQTISTVSLGTVTLADLTSGTHSAYVNAYDDDIVYVYGRMINPAGLTGTFQVIRSEEGGTGTWESIENGWGSNHCGSLVLTGDAKIWAIRNGATINLYGGTIAGSTLTQYSTLPLNAAVSRGGFTIAQNGNLFAASGVANSVMIVRSAPPYSTWSDITGAHAVDAGVKRLVAFE